MFDLQDLIIVSSPRHSDDRGSFEELYNREYLFKKTGKALAFVQDSLLYSKSGVLRGLHYQINEGAQYKLVACLQGSIFDVAVDMRDKSKNKGKWFGVELTSENRLQLLVPPGFAHGFLSLSDSIVLYKTDKYLDEKNSKILRWDDPVVGIEWPMLPQTLSKKDMNAEYLKSL